MGLSYNFQTQVAMKQAKSGTSAATFKLMEPYYYSLDGGGSGRLQDGKIANLDYDTWEKDAVPSDNN